MEYRIISADDHIDLPWLPKDLWEKRVPAQWRQRGPKVVDTPDGQFWVCGDERWDSWGGRKGAAEEVRYLKKIGVRTCMFLAARVETPLWDDAWEPLWAAGAETGLPIGFHLSGGHRTVVISGPQAHNPGNMGVRVSCSTIQMDEPLAALIFSGALERHPGLKIVLAETGIGWLPYMLERMDDTYQKFLDAPDYWGQHV